MVEPVKPRAVEWDLQVDVVWDQRKKKIYLLLFNNIWMADLAEMEEKETKKRGAVRG